ncbi:MAG: diacylglycerol kinase [Aeriscardovia sp.]|nr:diacylglycerol kinase [Aeriscardovia sp.]
MKDKKRHLLISAIFKIGFFVFAFAAVSGAAGGLLNFAKKKRDEKEVRKRRIEIREDDQSADYAFIINPSKPRAAKVEETVREFFAQRHMQPPVFINTLIEKDGYACAKEALKRGAKVVVACGGDGTVRTVGSALCGSGVPMGVLPIGTANLFAKNVGLPLDVKESLRVVVSHGSKKIDMGSMRFLDSQDPDFKHRFLLISGIGTDAEMIGLTNLSLKKYLGWGAYVIGGLKSIITPHYVGDISVEDEEKKIVRFSNVRFRSFLVGNCGKIPLLELMPGASYTDGVLDFKLLDTQKGLLGWAELISGLFYESKSKRSGTPPLNDAFTMREIKGLEASLNLREKAPVELDGDVVGKSSKILIEVEKQALILRVPEGSQEVDATGFIPLGDLRKNLKQD